MPGRFQIEPLLTLLRAQRREIATRSSLARGSAAWLDSSARLVALNDLIMNPPAAPTLRSHHGRSAEPGPHAR